MHLVRIFCRRLQSINATLIYKARWTVDTAWMKHFEMCTCEKYIGIGCRRYSRVIHSFIPFYFRPLAHKKQTKHKRHKATLSYIVQVIRQLGSFKHYFVVDRNQLCMLRRKKKNIKTAPREGRTRNYCFCWQRRRSKAKSTVI